MPVLIANRNKWQKPGEYLPVAMEGGGVSGTGVKCGVKTRGPMKTLKYVALAGWGYVRRVS